MLPAPSGWIHWPSTICREGCLLARGLLVVKAKPGSNLPKHSGDDHPGLWGESPDGAPAAFGVYNNPGMGNNTPAPRKGIDRGVGEWGRVFGTFTPNWGKSMIEIIFYGRGGQGVVVASKILAGAFFKEGWYVQSFPAFGGERRGAPVKAFLRADDKPIRRRSSIYQADHAILLDDTLFEEVPVEDEVQGAVSVVINCAKPSDAFSRMGASRIGTVNANAIASDLGLGTAVSPIVNTSMLGAFARVSRLLDLASVSEAISKNITVNLDKNISGAVRAFETVVETKGGGHDES